MLNYGSEYLSKFDVKANLDIWLKTNIVLGTQLNRWNVWATNKSLRHRKYLFIHLLQRQKTILWFSNGEGYNIASEKLLNLNMRERKQWTQRDSGESSGSNLDKIK